LYDFLIWKWFCGFNKNAGVASFMINSTWVTSWVTMKKAISRWWRVIYCKKIRKNLRKLEIETQEDFLGAKKKKSVEDMIQNDSKTIDWSILCPCVLHKGFWSCCSFWIMQVIICFQKKDILKSTSQCEIIN